MTVPWDFRTFQPSWCWKVGELSSTSRPARGSANTEFPCVVTQPKSFELYEFVSYSVLFLATSSIPPSPHLSQFKFDMVPSVFVSEVRKTLLTPVELSIGVRHWLLRPSLLMCLILMVGTAGVAWCPSGSVLAPVVLLSSPSSRRCCVGGETLSFRDSQLPGGGGGGAGVWCCIPRVSIDQTDTTRRSQRTAPLWSRVNGHWSQSDKRLCFV